MKTLKTNEKQESNLSFTDMSTIGAQDRKQLLKRMIRYLNYCCLHLIVREVNTVIEKNAERVTIGG